MLKGKRLAKIISVLLCVMMVVTLFPATAFATTGEEGATGGTPSSESGAPAEQTGGEGGTSQDGEEQSPGEEGQIPGEDEQVPGEGEQTPGEDEQTSGEDGLAPDEDGQSEEGDGEAAPAEHLVQFFANGDLFATASVKDGEAVSAPGKDPAAPESEDSETLVFLGWYADGSDTPYDFESPVRSNLNLYAKFGTPADEEENTPDGMDTPDGIMPFMAMAAGGGIMETDPVFRTYHFVAYGVEVSTQVVASGETLSEPAAPAPNAGERFIGWYDGETPFTSFGVQTFTDDAEFTINAKFAAAYVAFFHNADGAVIETRVPGTDNMVSTADVTGLQLGVNDKLVGWAMTSGGTTDVGASVEVKNGNVDLYPIITSVVWITFNTNGGTYLPPMAIGKGDYLDYWMVEDYIRSLTGSDTITRDGYTFVHWLANGGYFVFGWIYENMTLNAVWLEQDVDYTVVYWKQSLALGDNYTLDSTTRRSADAGDTVSSTSDDRSKFEGFTFNSGKSPSVTVAADGSTQLNLYYDRKNYTIDFKVPIVNGNHYEGAYTLLQPKNGPYGSPIGYWPSSSELTILNGYVFTGWYTKKGDEVQRFERFENSGNAVFSSSGNLTLYARFEDIGRYDRTFTVEHYLETAPGVFSSTPSASRSYTYNKYNYLQSYTFSDAYSGYSVKSYSTNLNAAKTNVSSGDYILVNPAFSSTISLIRVYYTLNQYRLSVYNGSTRIQRNDVPYLTALSGYEPAVPARPSGVDASANWAGWYTTQNGLTGSEMDWSGTMPAGDLSVYGVWKEPVFPAVAHMTPYGTSGDTRSLGSITYGEKVNSGALSAAEAAVRLNPPHAGDTFAGWLVLKNGVLTAFNPNAPVYGDLDIYPSWTSGLRYTVTYDLNGAGGTARTDSTLYAPGAQAQVLELNSDVTPPEGKVFIGWKSSLDGTLYYPGGTVIVTGDLILTAQWGDEAAKVHVTYYGNGGALSDGITTYVNGISVPNNTNYTLVSVGFVLTGHTFEGWNTRSDGTGTGYSVGDAVRLGLSGTVGGLYAVWKPISYDVRLSLAVDGTATGLTGAGPYDYHESATLSWTPASGFETASVTDNGVAVTASGNSYTINLIEDSHDVVVTMQQKDFTLTYAANDGSTANDASSVEKGTSFRVAANSFTYPGHDFLGWSTNSAATAADPFYAPGQNVTMPASDLTLYAVWADSVYAVTLRVEPSGQASGLYGAGSYGYLDDATLGWTPAPGYETVKVTDNGAEIPMSGDEYAISAIEGNHEVVVTLEQKDFTLTYLANDGTANEQTHTVERFDTFTVAGEIFSYAGHYFLGWSTDSAASAADGAYTPAGTATMPESDLTLYAVWGTKMPLTLTSIGDNVNYDGTTHRVSGFTASETGLTFEGISAEASGKNPGEYKAAFSDTSKLVIKRTSDNLDVTDRYTVAFKESLLTVNPKVTYVDSVNGTEYASEFVAYGTGDASYPKKPLNNVSASGRDYYWLGTYDIEATDPAANNLTANLTITANYALNKTLVITGGVASATYNGSLQQLNTATLSDSSLTVTGYTAHGEGTKAGEYDVVVTLGTGLRIENSLGDDVTYQYNVETAKGKLTIQPVPITVTAQDKSWVYDGSEHVWQSYDVSGSFIGDEGIESVTFDPASKVKNVGPVVANTITGITLKSNTDEDNYSFTTVPGALTVTKAPALRVTATPETVVYDGGNHSIGVSASDMDGTEFYYSLAGGTDLSTYTKGEYVGVNVADSTLVYVAAVNPNYDTGFGSAQLTISRRILEFTSDSAKKVYDATPLTAPGVTMTLGNFAPGEGFDTAPASTTEQIAAGVRDNEFVLPSLRSGTLADNYTMSRVYGTLTVERRNILIIVDDVEKNYGDPDPAFTYRFQEGAYLGITFYSVLAGDLAGVKITPARTDAGLPWGEDPGVHRLIHAEFDASSSLLNPSYFVRYVIGALTINPQITYLPGTAEVVTGMPAAQWAPYDGSAVLSSGATAARTGFTLVGWLDAATGTTYALGATMANVQQNTELTAVWEANRYDIVFITGTGAAVANMPATITGAAYRSTVTLPAALPTRAGFTFAGWQSGDVDGTVRTYGAGTGFTMPNQAIAFTATWDADINLVYYHTNFPGGTTAQEGHATLSTVTVAANSFVRTGYRFLGWSETAGGGVSRQPGDTFVMPAAEVHLYAQWERQEYTVTYYVTGGTGTGLDGAQAYATYTGLGYGDTMPVPDDPQLEGYTFSGWTPDVPATVPDGGLTLNGTLTPLAAAPLEQIGDEETPLAGKKAGVPLWAILSGSGLLLGLGGFFLFFLLAKRRKDEDEQQGAE